MAVRGNMQPWRNAILSYGLSVDLLLTPGKFISNPWSLPASFSSTEVMEKQDIAGNRVKSVLWVNKTVLFYASLKP